MLSGIDDLQILLQRQIGVKTIHICTWQHDLTSEHIREIKDVIHQFDLILINNSTLGTLFHENAQLIL
ncbi:hypothetical protein D3C75_1388120 [compost metagenome]